MSTNNNKLYSSVIKSFLLMTLTLNLHDKNNVSSAPHKGPKFQKPLFDIERNSDGSISGSFAMAESVDLPGMSNSFSTANTFRIGPDGASFSNSDSSSMNSGIGPFKSSFSHANALSTNAGPGGFSNAVANAQASSISNPFFQSSFSNANANTNSISNFLF